MNKSIKGTKTEKHLLMAFAGESQARSRYTFFASVAKKEGYEQIAGVFMETAEQEKEHAKRFFSFLEGGMLEITASFPAGIIGSTAENLRAAAAGENEEWTDLWLFWLMWKMDRSLSERKKSHGNVAIAAMSLLPRKLRSYVPLALIRRLTSSQ